MIDNQYKVKLKKKCVINVVSLLLICLIPLFSERSTFAFFNRLTRFHAAREALGFSLYKYLTVLLFSAV